jgi:hypothetical protein
MNSATVVAGTEGWTAITFGVVPMRPMYVTPRIGS